MKIAEFEIENDDSFTVVTNNILRNKDLSMSAKDYYVLFFHYHQSGIIHLMD